MSSFSLESTAGGAVTAAIAKAQAVLGNPSALLANAGLGAALHTAEQQSVTQGKGGAQQPQGGLIGNILSGITDGILAGAVGYAAVAGIGALAGGAGAAAASGAGVLASTPIAGFTSLAGGTITGSISGLISGGASTVTGILGSILNPIDNAIQDVNSVLNSTLNPIITAIDRIANVTNGLIAAVKGDLNGTIQGLLQIPLDLGNALTEYAGAFSLAEYQLGETQGNIVQATFVGPDGETAGTSLHGIHSTMVDAFQSPTLEGARPGSLPLDDPTVGVTLQEARAAFEQKGELLPSFFRWISSIFFDALQLAEMVAASFDARALSVQAQTLKAYPERRMDPSTILDGWRKQVLAESDARSELQEYGYDADRQTILHQLSKFFADPQLAVEWYFRGFIAESDARLIMAQQGLDADQQTLMLDTGYRVPALAEIGEWYLRERADEASLRQALAQAHYRPEHVDAILATLLKPPDLSLAVETRGRELAAGGGLLGGAWAAPAPADLQTLATHNDRPADDINRLWLAHWKWIGPGTAVQAYYRGLIDAVTLQLIFDANNIPPELTPVLMEVDRPLIPIWEVIPMMTAGFLDPTRGRGILAKLGFASDDIEALIQYSGVKNAKSQHETAQNLQGVTVGLGKTLYEDGAITETEYRLILSTLGYGSDTVDLEVTLTQTAMAASARKAEGAYLLAMAESGQITVGDMQSRMLGAGFTLLEVEGYVTTYTKKVTVKGKLPTKAEAEKLWKDGYLSDADLLNYYSTEGYAASWGEIFLNALKGVTPPTAA